MGWCLPCLWDTQDWERRSQLRPNMGSSTPILNRRGMDAPLISSFNKHIVHTGCTEGAKLGDPGWKQPPGTDPGEVCPRRDSAAEGLRGSR